MTTTRKPRSRTGDGIEPYATAEGVRYRIRYRDQFNKQRKEQGLPDRKAAFARKAELMREVAEGSYINPADGRTKIGELGERFLKVHNAGPATMARYRSAWRTRVQAKWALVPVANVRPSHVTEWINDMRAAGLSPATINSAHDLLSGILNLAVGDGCIKTNHAAPIKRQPKQRKRGRVLTHKQIAAMAAVAAERGYNGYAPYGLAVRVLGYCGMRFGELSALRVRDFDPSSRRLTIRDAASVVEGRRIVGTTKTGRERWVPVPGFLVPALVAHARGMAPDAWLFVGPQGAPLDVHTFRTRVWNTAFAAVRKADPTMPAKVTPHDMRRTAINLAIQAGADPKSVQQLAGHDRFTTTMDIYGDLMPSALDRVGEAMHAAAVEALGADFLAWDAELAEAAEAPEGVSD